RTLQGPLGRRARRRSRRVARVGCLAVAVGRTHCMAHAVDRSAGRRRAKEPRTTVAGPYGHPFHPILVTIPIGAFVCSFIFDILSRARSQGREFLVDGAYWLIGIGIVAALLAAVFGLLDLFAIPRHTRAFATGLTHLALNLVVVSIF